MSPVAPPDTYLNGAVFDVVGDRHVAPRNIHVVSLAGAQKSLSFAFALVNPLDKEAEFTLQAREVRLGRGAEVVRRALGCAFAPSAATPLEADRLLIADRQPEEQGDNPRDRSAAFGVLRRPKDVGRSQRGRVVLAADETRPAVVTLTGGGVKTGVDGAVVGGSGSSRSGSAANGSSSSALPRRTGRQAGRPAGDRKRGGREESW